MMFLGILGPYWAGIKGLGFRGLMENLGPCWASIS